LNNSRRKEEKVNVNVIVIGGGPAGIITALTAKSVYPEKSVCLFKDIGDGVIPCAIPYMMHTLKDPNLRKRKKDSGRHGVGEHWCKTGQ
jgi:flavin-dependent dehydrogenase